MPMRSPSTQTLSGRGMMGKWLRPGEQPRLQEMLDDPIVRLVMRRDGVARDQVEQLVRSLVSREDWRDAETEALPPGRSERPDILATSLCAARRRVAADSD